ncbi:molybdopterin molybdotransferase MoeA [Pseudothauera nasutitermitis]|uniref:Molybdopterin molybdenumtransferase n=1 Tax=Pseudothauera nasutitermitis TaxID=2565930 RepID=A0A4S4ARF2_9RHOO|nr:gephyrin-like molybdotransferase Glp [Pseudothauera nasutitermitis]THF62360.1 molybdopterin molybdotransferase MoeA [Pseudothauera nasutitermitis]
MSSTRPRSDQASSQGLGVAEARAAILRALRPVDGHECVALRAALGRVLAEDVVAPLDVPAHDNSAMDGYALRAADLAADADTALTVVGRAFAGHPFAGRVEAGQAVRIMTGAPLPQGADTVVMQEDVRPTPSQGDAVLIPPGQRAGQNVRRAGEDLPTGGIALPAGKRCGPAELGLIASLGLDEVLVYRRPRVAFFSTGDEIASLGEALGPGQVYDSNRYTLYGLLAQLGCEVDDLGVLPDQPEALQRALAGASATADVILTSGGVSTGEADFVRETLAGLGEVDFWKLAIKPGRPLAFGRIGRAWLFGLPGNPVATMVAFCQFVRDALLTLAGVSPLPEPVLFTAHCATPIRKQPGRHEFQRGRLGWEDGRRVVHPAAAQGSGILRSMSEADCFILLPEAQGSVAAGEAVLVQPFAGLL